MTSPVKTAQAKLVVVIGPFEFADHLPADFKKLGVHGFSMMRVDGVGAHGPRKYGVFDGANIRFDIVGTAELAQHILHHIVTSFDGRGIVAYAHDVEAVPFDHFQ